MYEDILDLHTHTIASGHAYNSLYEMAQAASQKGLALYGCSDHAPAMPGSADSIYFINFKVIPREIRGVRVLMGAELNILNFDGKVDLSPGLLRRLDYAIASLHTNCIKSGTMEENTRAYVKVMENPLIQIIGHPDDGRFPIDYERLVTEAKRQHKLLEVNNTSLSPDSSRPGARENYRTMLSLCRRHEQPVIINSDAHIEADVGNHRFAHQFLEELDFPPQLVVNSSLERLAAYLPSLAGLLAGRWAR